ncbi:MAG: glutamine amidotransferase [Planctomycetaceae bacterium]|jgi:uncharacterized membrane protein|nr:glutamine amidotransferase [Planctomycetaceae bacterium]
MYIYLGDDDITRAASYLCGVLTYARIPFDRVNSSETPPARFTSTQYDAYIISDYPRTKFRTGQMEHLCNAVTQGAGLLMIGGWESFHGQHGEYHDSPLAEVLPVQMLHQDDRRNFSQSALVLKHHNHPILEGLPWEKPPFIGGLNQFSVKPNANLLLKAITTDIRIVQEDEAADCNNDSIFNYINKPVEERFSVSLSGGDAMFLTLAETFPLLVVGQYGKGRTAALATDVAPHWVGGWVDWGKKRISQKLDNQNSIEVGANYVQFFTQLTRWLSKQY